MTRSETGVGQGVAGEKTAMAAALLAPGAGGQRRAAVLSVLAALIWPLIAALVAVVIGGLLKGEIASPLGTAALFAGLGGLRVLLIWLADRQAREAAEAVVSTARIAILDQESRRTGDGAFGGAGAVAALAGEKLELLVPFITRYQPARARVMLVPLVILGLALWFSWAVALIFLISGPLIPLFMALVGMAAKEASTRHLAEIGSLNDSLLERFSALVDIRLLGASGEVLEEFRQRAADLRQRTMAVLRIAFLSSTLLELFAAIGVAMVAVYVGFSALGALEFGSWGSALSPEAGLFLLLLAPEFYQPMRDLAGAWHDKAAADAVIEDVARWQGDEVRPLLGSGGPATPLPGPATIRLSGCRTPSGRLLPEMIIHPGERVALVGPSGAGKTSALRLMAGLLAADDGTVEVAGHRLDAAIADNWRARLGWMPQAPHFLNESLTRTITMDRPGDMAAALDLAAASDVVANLPRGLATRLGETGAGLSGGEARRITLARAVFGRPDVLLADEPTADLDRDTAELVIAGLMAEADRGATLVIATHDPALAARMDRVIDLGEGLA